MFVSGFQAAWENELAHNEVLEVDEVELFIWLVLDHKEDLVAFIPRFRKGRWWDLSNGRSVGWKCFWLAALASERIEPRRTISEIQVNGKTNLNSLYRTWRKVKWAVIKVFYLHWTSLTCWNSSHLDERFMIMKRKASDVSHHWSSYWNKEVKLSVTKGQRAW